MDLMLATLDAVPSWMVLLLLVLLLAAILFNECTFIVPNSVGLYLTNGIRVEWLNSFVYFANEGIKGVQGATGAFGTGRSRLKLSGVSGNFVASEGSTNEDQFRSGTYARSGSTVTVTNNNHGLAQNDRVYADFISGAATDGFFQVTAVTTNIYIYPWFLWYYQW